MDYVPPKYVPVVYATFDVRLPPLNWKASVSVDVFNFADETPYKVFWQSEPDTILPNRQKIIANHKFYDLILTHNESVLGECGNAKFFPPGGVWCQSADVSQKRFAASMLTSSKNMCHDHAIRLGVYDRLPGNVRSLAIAKHKSPPRIETKHDLLVPFQYHIVMENSRRNFFYSEKILDAFATKTIPIYYGCPGIGNYFNKDGIKEFSDFDSLFHVLMNLTPDFYGSAKVQAAIEENYTKALQHADRTNNLARAIEDSWTPKIDKIWSGENNDAGATK